MIKEHHPKPEPRPQGMGEEEIIRDHFDDKWNREVEKHKEKDAFDKIDEQKEWSDRLGRNRGLERD